MKIKNNLSFSEVSKLLNYDPESGLLTWAVNRRGSAKIGSIAGTRVKTTGYKVLRINGEAYKTHRIAWLLYFGKMPDGDIDHINRDRGDNRICNLRMVDRSTNQRNRKISKNNTSGHTGVSYHKRDGLWRASINVNGKELILGNYDEKRDAILRRRLAEIAAGYHPNHGKIIKGDEETSNSMNK